MSNAFNNGLEKIRSIVSAEWYFDSETAINQRGQTAIPVPKKPLAFIYPENTNQIKDILKVANDYGIPIWPLSKGYNWGVGAATAVRDGGLIMVLERLNRIIEVNEELAYAVVEPGVTYSDLHNYLTEHNINLCVDAIDGPADSSILGNALERGRGRTNYGDHFSNLCGIEVILPNGETLKTGGGPENSKSWNVYKYGVGPWIDGLFTQGNYGVVTKGGMWLMPKHECCVSIFLGLNTNQDLIKAVDIFRRLQLEGVIESKMGIGNDCYRLSSLIDYPSHLAKSGFLSESDLSVLREQYNLEKWAATGAIYGTYEMIKVKQRRLKKELSGLGKLIFINDSKSSLLSSVVENAESKERKSFILSLLGRVIEKATGKQLKLFIPLINMHNFHRGIPSDAMLKTVNFGEPTEIGYKNTYDMTLNKTGFIWFTPAVPLDGKIVSFVNEECQKICHQHKFDYSAGMLLLEARSIMIIMKITYNKEDQERSEQAMVLFRALHNWCIKNGFQVYRTNVAHMEELLDCAPIFKSFVNEIKTAIDPNNIIAPGKYGVG